MLCKYGSRESWTCEDCAIKSYFYHEDYVIKIKFKMIFLISDYLHFYFIFPQKMTKSLKCSSANYERQNNMNITIILI